MPDMGSGRWPIPALQLPSADAPVTQRPQPDGPPVSLPSSLPGEPVPETWTLLPNLDSGPFDQSFVVETDNDGTSSLRFGDDQYGRRPYGRSGVHRTAIELVTANRQIGWGSLVHLVDPGDHSAGQPGLAAPARQWRGRAEMIEHVRQIAPEAFAPFSSAPSPRWTGNRWRCAIPTSRRPRPASIGPAAGRPSSLPFIPSTKPISGGSPEVALSRSRTLRGPSRPS